jgi:hypothetical protein
MADKIYFNAPCKLYRGFLDDRKYSECLEDVLAFAAYAQSSKAGCLKKDFAEYVREHLQAKLVNPDKFYQRGSDLFFNTVGRASEKPAFFSVSSDMYWWLRDKPAREERAVALAYLAIKSMIGKREYVKTNMTLLCNRMDGRTRYTAGKEASPEIAKYANRYWGHKLLAMLYDKYGVTIYSGSVAHKMRGFYCSCTLTMTELIRKVEQSRAEAKARPKDPLKEAQREALAELGMPCNGSP